MRPVVPMRDLAMRLPDAGRIRIGIKGSKGQPQKLDRFRFTSNDPAALGQVADLYGGEVKPWTDPKAGAGQHEVITEAREIRIALPPDPLGNTPIYEMWSGGGCQRRCDGEMCELQVSGPDGIDLQQTNCLCNAKGELACKVVTRLSVLLPEIRFVGVWRLDSHGWNAAQELPGMVQLVRSLQDRGIVRGLLRVEERVQILAGKTFKYMVPVIGVDDSIEALAAGAARFGVLGADSSVPMLSSGGEPSLAPSDDDVVDAEVIDERSLADVLPESINPARALLLARSLADEYGVEIPTDCDQVTDYRLVARVLDELSA